MVDFRQLRDADFNALTTAAYGWRNHSELLRKSSESYNRAIVGGVRDSGWQGLAATAATEEIRREHERLQRAVMIAFSVHNSLSRAANEFKEYQDDLRSAINDAGANNLRVGDDGSLTLPEMTRADRHDAESQRLWSSLRERASQISTAFKRAVDGANATDRRLTMELGLLASDRVWREDLPLGIFDLPPLWPATDFGRPFGVETPSERDRETHKKLELVVLGGMAKEWPIASGLLAHWLDGSGSPRQVNVDELMKQSPEFQRSVQEQLNKYRGSHSFDTGWMSTRFNERENLDLYYAFNGYQYRIRGEGDNYTIEFYKRYNFGNENEQRGPLHLPALGTIHQNDISHLHTSGMARDFDVYGSTTHRRP
ncbi:hypothetical protein [Thermomonospora amylolytica]|uniref:hypothetical protein n=1 Tax=Thermomonospora amylolytica TaxID=1411117 RepID=UPI001300627A|nr:hypothetical protein [Thermomonospora amylolytica]